MINYNTLKSNLKRGIQNYSQKISKGLSKPIEKFILQMIYGLLTAQSCHLSKISRVLNEEITLKKTIDRLSRNLNNFKDGEILHENYLESIKPNINESSLLLIDGSDITKNYATKMEGITLVRDGSTGELKNGYNNLGIVALSTEKKMPIPVYSKIYSTIKEGFISETSEVLQGLKFLRKHFSKKCTRVFDRGYDNNKYYTDLLKNDESFVIRAKKNRDVLYKGKKINILTLAKKLKGKYCFNFTKKDGVKVQCKVSILTISLPSNPNKKLNLVVCYGFGKEPMLLITNLNSDDPKISVVITKVYLLRWRIEEYFRFTKQQFNFEDLRVRSLNSIQNLNLILMITTGYISIMGENSDKNITTFEVIDSSKRIYNTNKFLLYALADGLFFLLNFSYTGISRPSVVSRDNTQIYLFECSFKRSA